MSPVHVIELTSNITSDDAATRAEDALRRARRRGDVTMDLALAEEAVIALLLALAAEVPQALTGARAQIKLTATAIRYALETPRDLHAHLVESAQAARGFGTLLPQDAPEQGSLPQARELPRGGR